MSHIHQWVRRTASLVGHHFQAAGANIAWLVVFFPSEEVVGAGCSMMQPSRSNLKVQISCTNCGVAMASSSHSKDAQLIGSRFEASWRRAEQKPPFNHTIVPVNWRPVKGFQWRSITSYTWGTEIAYQRQNCDATSALIAYWHSSSINADKLN